MHKPLKRWDACLSLAAELAPEWILYSLVIVDFFLINKIGISQTSNILGNWSFFDKFFDWTFNLADTQYKVKLWIPGNQPAHPEVNTEHCYAVAISPSEHIGTDPKHLCNVHTMASYIFWTKFQMAKGMYCPSWDTMEHVQLDVMNHVFKWQIINFTNEALRFSRPLSVWVWRKPVVLRYHSICHSLHA